MGYPGYQQQNWPGGVYYPGYSPNDVDPFAGQGSKALARLSAILGLGLAGVLTWQALALMPKLAGVEGLAGVWHIAQFVVASIVLIGAVLVFARRIVGAFVLSAGALIALAGLFLAPLTVPEIASLMADPSSTVFVPSRRSGYGDYLKAVFESGNELAILQLVAMIIAFLVMIGAVLPPSRNWLRRRSKDDDTARQAGW